MINSLLTALRVFRILPALSLLVLITACPQMQTPSLVGGGAPMGATRDEKAVTEKTLDSDEFTVPSSTGPSAAPLPGPVAGPVAGTVGGDPVITPPAEPAFRRIEGGGVIGGDVAIPIYGTVPGEIASRDGGIFGAATPTERIDQFVANVRVVSWPASYRRPWTDHNDLQEKLRNGEISEEAASQARVEHFNVYVESFNPHGLIVVGRGLDPTVARPENIPDVFPSHPAGYYVFFVTKDGYKEDLGGEFETVASLDSLKAYLNDPRLIFAAEKTIWTLPHNALRNWIPLYLFPIEINP